MENAGQFVDQGDTFYLLETCLRASTGLKAIPSDCTDGRRHCRNTGVLAASVPPAGYRAVMAELNAHVHGLVELGMTRYEAKAYLTLIQRESYAASELANEAGIPRQRIYDVLNSLVSRGLARDWPGPVTRYAATDPQAAVERLLAVQRQALAGLESQSADLAAGLRDTWVGRPGRDRAAGLRRGAARPRPGRRPVPRPAARGRASTAHLLQVALRDAEQPGRPGGDPPDRGRPAATSGASTSRASWTTPRWSPRRWSSSGPARAPG